MNSVLLKRRSSDCLCSQPSKVLSGCNRQRKRLNFAPMNWSIVFWKTSFFLFSFLESRVGENFENGNRTFPLSFIFLFSFLSYSALGIKKKIERKIMKREIMKMSK